MNINDITIGQFKEFSKLFNGATETPSTLNSQVGEKVIIRTYSAGVWFGELIEKAGKEVILKDARRMHYWKAEKSISLSGVAVYGVKDCSKICPAIDKQWLEAIEILSCTHNAIKSIESQKDVEAN